MSQYIVNLTNNYYYEFIFNSKVLDPKGKPVNQFHKVYSSEYTSANGSNGIAVAVSVDM
jgi:hypothetical protein